MQALPLSDGQTLDLLKGRGSGIAEEISNVVRVFISSTFTGKNTSIGPSLSQECRGTHAVRGAQVHVPLFDGDSTGSIGSGARLGKQNREGLFSSPCYSIPYWPGPGEL